MRERSWAGFMIRVGLCAVLVTAVYSSPLRDPVAGHGPPHYLHRNFATCYLHRSAPEAEINSPATTASTVNEEECQPDGNRAESWRARSLAVWRTLLARALAIKPADPSRTPRPLRC
jgi:hypothetical protein